MHITLICEDSFDGMMSGVYEGWIRMNQGHTIHIHPGTLYEYSFLTEYVEVKTNPERAMKVADSIRRKISTEAYKMVYRACMHYSEERVDAVVDFLKEGYRVGGRITKDLGNPVVMKVLEYSRKAINESHLFKEFIRFREIDGKILFSRITPKCDVLSLIAYHFQDRFPLENWIIYDETRKKALVHQEKMESILISGTEIEKEIDRLEKKDDYEELWKLFFHTIGIKERENYNCQRNHLPKWYRQNMLEFDKNGSDELLYKNLSEF